MTLQDILVIEDDPHTCSFLAKAASDSGYFATVHRALSFVSARQIISTTPALGMVLCDIGLPDGDGLELLAQTVELEIPTIVISAMGDEHIVVTAIEIGASGYLHKDLDAGEIVTAIQQVLQGGAPLSPSIASHLLRKLKKPEARIPRKAQSALHEDSNAACTTLTERETEILQMIARGFLFKEVAEELNLSPHTISNHNRNIYRKLRVRSRSEAVFKAMKTGLIESRI